MDPSLGDRKASLWRSTEDKKGAKEKKEAKKPHWLVAKEAGKRKNGSEKRKKRVEAPAQTPAAAAPAKKKTKVAREMAMEARAMDAEHQRDYLWGTLKEAIAGVVEARMPPETAFVASPAMQRAATVGERIQAAIEATGGDVWRAVRHAGKQRKTARVLVLSLGALRCVDVINQIRPLLGPEAPGVAKLWAKHMDVEEQKTHLATHYCGKEEREAKEKCCLLTFFFLPGIGVGTPNRIAKLFEDESLTLSHTALVVVDCEPNAKQQTIFTLPETAADLFGFLALCLKRLNKGKLKIAFC